MVEIIEYSKGEMLVPENVLLPYVQGDGIGRDIVPVGLKVLNEAIKKSYKGKKQVRWLELPAGEKAEKEEGELLPESTLRELSRHHVAIKGPLTTPVGKGYRSLNVAIRKKLDLYANVRHIRYFKGVPSPVKSPEKLDVVIFREATEDVYAGIEFQSKSKGAKELLGFLNKRNLHLHEDSALGIKIATEHGSKRLVKKAIEFALKNKREKVTLVHKGNIMKYTEGAFREWGYEIAKKYPLPVDDILADNMFQQVLLKPEQFDVIATPNLNGDYLSEACAAQVGGVGLIPGGNIGDTVAVFEVTHGTAPKYAGKDLANPASFILSGAMMLSHIGWEKASLLIENAVQKTIAKRKVTQDLARNMKGVKALKCSAFAAEVIKNL